jgi:hypothetical protein
MTQTRSAVKVRSSRVALLGALLLGPTLTACEGDADAGAPAHDASSAEESATPSAAYASLPTDDGGVMPGTYLVPSSRWSSVDFSITFPEDWFVREGKIFDTNIEQPDELGIQTFVVTKIYADACRGQRGAETKIGPTVDDLVDALLAQPGPDQSSRTTTVGGYPATRIDLKVPDSLQSKDCFMGPGTGLQIWHNGPDNYLVLDPQGLLSVYVVDVDGERAVFTSQYRPAHTSPEDEAELHQVVDSIQIPK